ncbi:TrkA-C domain containing protein [Nitzschia inconspicua]|uniref:TrkA-C domain containing protein n=1 Tax=Nitzschia inconspicua TaxID=303405 RepID=A0A9K3PBG0_9STRA|nr:TrkA-C domain containing protein [Nitzschia inconspicua]
MTDGNMQYHGENFVDADPICPCLEATSFRDLQEANVTTAPTAAPQTAPGSDAELWESIYTTVVLVAMFVALVSDRIGADSVMLCALTFFMAAEIITIKEGLEGFANEGVLTVMILFVVAEGISKTGALDWYMSKLLGRPKTIAGAQLRLMLPVTFVSAFLNNTPVVAVMIPIVLRWAKNVGLPPQQLMIPLSYASIVGGTCTLIGTSTNLVVSGLLVTRYPNNPEVQVGLFDLSIYGVPVALVSVVYVIVASKWLLPGGRGKAAGEVPFDTSSDNILLGAKLMPWSPAAGRSVKRSGLRNTGGIYLVSVHRAATGNIHRAVGQEFVLNAGDILYFTGLIEGFDEFCEEHGMKVISDDNPDGEEKTLVEAPFQQENETEVPITEIGVTKESLLGADEAERSRTITRMIDLIRGAERDEPTEEVAAHKKKVSVASKVVVSSERGNVTVGIDAVDRPGLLLDISKGIVRLNLTLRHTEASVVDDRSISIWRCETIGTDLPDLEEIWSVLSTLLESLEGAAGEGLKKKGTPVIRAVVTPMSTLIGNSSTIANFSNRFKAAIIAAQRGGKNISTAGLVFAAGDVLILQVTADSPLLLRPPVGFYKKVGEKESFVKKLTKSFGAVPEGQQQSSSNHPNASEAENLEENRNPNEGIWKDLYVVVQSPETSNSAATREFLTAMEVAPKSQLSGRTAAEADLDKLPGIFLVSIDRPTVSHSTEGDPEDVSSLATLDHLVTISPDTPLQDGDIIWFAGDARSVGDLRKIPGLNAYVKEVGKINDKVFDRRLVEAVIARRGPLVGKTVKEVQFRTRYGAAVIAVHRDGAKIHEHPSRIKLQAGDVLLLEAGPTFMQGKSDSSKAFSLLAEVKDSAPPRLNMLFPAVFLTVLMLALTTARLSPLIVLALLVSFIFVGIGVLSEQEARDAVNWQVFVTIACAFGIGTALVNSGVAGAVAGFLVKIGTSVGSGYSGLYGAVYLATFLISNIVTNNAAAALLFPIAMNAAEQTGADLVLMAYSLMLGASASFMSPFGYQTNLMVYGPGGYRTTDFVWIGTPMQIILWIFSTILLGTTTLSNFYLSWLASLGALVVASVVMLIGNPFSCSGKKSDVETSAKGNSEVLMVK